MNTDLRNVRWPASRLAEALKALALRSRLTTERADLPQSEDIEASARSLGLEAQPAETAYADFERQLCAMGPAILRLPDSHESAFLAILRGNAGRVTILGPDSKLHRLAADRVRAAACQEMEGPWILEADELLAHAQIPEARRILCREAILRERFGAVRIGGIWLLRLSPGADFMRQLRSAGIPQRVLALAGLHAFQYLLWIVAWWVIGDAVFGGRFEQAWLIAWALLLFSLVPCRVMITWLQGAIAIGSGTIMKQRLFYGALHLQPDSIRHQGVGQLLGRVIESEAVEALALSGGFLGLVATVELLFAAVVLGYGAGGVIHVLALLAWILFTAIIGRSYFRRYQSWTDSRLTMTHDLVESMVGHRTRLAQQPPETWHDAEDEALASYVDRARGIDELSAVLGAIVPRGWMVLGLAALMPALLYATDATPRLAVAIGGILLAYRAFKRLSAGLSQILGAAVAWRRVAPLFQAAAGQGLSVVPKPAGEIVPVEPPILEACDLVFRYHPNLDPVLRSCSFRFWRNERVVLEGASGSGKSTLVSILIGLRAAESGSLSIGGQDRKQLSSQEWRRRAAAAPQFHDNHVLAETFAFNLLMGRDCVPGQAELSEAGQICAELGLGDLLHRMPAGMLQMVGESGWQLSHGERSRLYIARALLQNADLVVLDESFAALDPENLKLVVECVLKRARALLVIAHR